MNNIQNIFISSIPAQNSSSMKKKIQATIMGVNQYGWLQLSVSDGKIVECDMKQVQFIVGK